MNCGKTISSPKIGKFPREVCENGEKKQYILHSRHSVAAEATEATEATEAMIRFRAFLVVSVLVFCISGCLANPFVSFYPFSSGENELGHNINVNMEGIHQLYPEVHTSIKVYHMMKELK